MSDFRALDLRAIMRQGRFGATSGTPGVTLSLVHPVSLVHVLARTGGAKTIEAAFKALRAVRVMQAGPSQFYVQATGRAEGALASELKAKLVGAASIVDQSHGRVVIRIAGTKSRSVLAKGMPLDLHADVFPLDFSAQTQMAHVSVHVTRTAEDEFEISVFRGFSESLWEWLCHAAAEYGYEVRKNLSQHVSKNPRQCRAQEKLVALADRLGDFRRHDFAKPLSAGKSCCETTINAPVCTRHEGGFVGEQEADAVCDF